MTANHVRAQIRANAAAALRAAGIVGADSVLPGRRRPTTQAKLPALLVYTDDEASARLARSDGRSLRARQVQLVIRCRLSTVADPPQDELDALAAAVERAIDADETLGGLLIDLELARTESGVPSPMSDRQLGEVDVIYLADYHALSGDPARAIV